MQTRYPVKEIFSAFQGEGFHSGLAAGFVRLYGCPLKCSWCDSADTWKKELMPKEIEKLTPKEINERLEIKEDGFLVVTGGEPAIHDLSCLVEHIRKERNINVHIETSGSYEINGRFDWVTVSPKWSKLPTKHNIEIADEIKIIVEDLGSIEKWLAAIPEIRKKKVFLQPEWSKSKDQEVLDYISWFVKKTPGYFRASFQMHKIYKVDDLETKGLIQIGRKNAD